MWISKKTTMPHFVHVRPAVRALQRFWWTRNLGPAWEFGWFRSLLMRYRFSRDRISRYFVYAVKLIDKPVESSQRRMVLEVTATGTGVFSQTREVAEDALAQRQLVHPLLHHRVVAARTHVHAAIGATSVTQRAHAPYAHNKNTLGLCSNQMT
jgi:hypothetical protein